MDKKKNGTNLRLSKPETLQDWKKKNFTVLAVEFATENTDFETFCSNRYNEFQGENSNDSNAASVSNNTSKDQQFYSDNPLVAGAEGLKDMFGGLFGKKKK